MDLASIDTKELAETGAVMTVEHPGTGAPVLDEAGKETTITLLGADSAKLRKRQNDLINDVMKKGFRPKSVTAEKSEEDKIVTLALATVAWSGIKVDGEALECNFENAKRLYRRLPWLKDQADSFVGDRANFTKA
ncbi:hypothetical protein [Shinella pollutisoli]|uniref:Tail assembly chaperone n=1 Tax=Shinella pollutisoli TaxID=2250594 RepID=A0ABV7DCD7_9HYPH|nr:hypothetical protein [Shinella pollutisoli]